jgi:hypothetical protein
LAEGPAKLIKKFRQNFEWNSNSAGMQEFPSAELHWNRICVMCMVPNNVQIECQQTPTLDLGKQTMSSSTTTTTTINDTHPPSPPHHRHLITTIMLSSPSTTPASIDIHRLQPAQHEQRGFATSPNERVLAMSLNKRVLATSIPHDNEEDDEGKVPCHTTNNDIVIVCRCCLWLYVM